MFVFYFENIPYSFHIPISLPMILLMYDIFQSSILSQKGENIKHIHYIGNEGIRVYRAFKPHWFNFNVFWIMRFLNGVTMTFSVENVIVRKMVKNRTFHNGYWVILRPLDQAFLIVGAGRMALCSFMGFMPISHFAPKEHTRTTHLSWGIKKTPSFEWDHHWPSTEVLLSPLPGKGSNMGTMLRGSLYSRPIGVSIPLLSGKSHESVFHSQSEGRLMGQTGVTVLRILKWSSGIT